MLWQLHHNRHPELSTSTDGHITMKSKRSLLEELKTDGTIVVLKSQGVGANFFSGPRFHHRLPFTQQDFILDSTSFWQTQTVGEAFSIAGHSIGALGIMSLLGLYPRGEGVQH
ncbi:hypothetical protein BG74_02445 [Sodalis-like endosymbiont of Proechinophthirus fluctus]|nr:hypothetical protein [Sodalis-like endosymbiont of Proechinophthirus fluctus]KYP97534.1 hypothetical protein BG74_02445 [Sodalis-like endosymbiont of Proechinophthirus fluctus]